MIERMVRIVLPQYSAVFLRYFNAAGADPEDVGKIELETHLIPLVIRVSGQIPKSKFMVRIILFGWNSGSLHPCK
jgi:UDP-glucose 4-epimerase